MSATPDVATDNLFYRDLKRVLPTIVRGEGVYLYDQAGNRYLDGCSGSLVANIGHGCERVAAAAYAQARLLAFTHLSRFSNEPAVALANRIAELAPGSLNKVYFTSGGSEATESALKLARQYFLDRDGSSNKWKVIARRQSYHGATIGALSMTGDEPRRRQYDPILTDFPHIAPCYCYRCPFDKQPETCGLPCADALEEAILKEGAENVAAFIAEPIVGAAAGALVPPPGYWERIRDICNQYDILLIADEVMTGFGRTGTMFALDQTTVVPDMICVAKGMSAGYAPLGAIIVKDEIVEVLRAGSGRFVHGHTYGGNPLSTAIGLEVVAYLLEENLVENSRQQGAYLLEKLKELQQRFSIIGDVRGRGLMIGVELVADRESKTPYPARARIAERFTQCALRHGVVVYPGQGCADGVNGDQFLVGPPLTITQSECDELVAGLADAFAAFELELYESEGANG